MGVDKKHWISNGAEIVKSGDLVRLRGDDGEWSEWGSADHLAGSRVDSFAQWYGMGVQFARVPTATTEQPRRFADELQRWQQESTPEPQWEMVNDRDYLLRPGVDQVRCRTYLNESEHWGPWIAWHTIEAVQTVGGFINGPGGTSAAQEWQFRRRVAGTQPAADQPAPEPEWEPLAIQDDTILQPGRDEVRLQSHDGGRWCAWMPLSGGPLLATAFLAQRPSDFTYEFRRLKAAPEQSPAPTPDRGSKYHRTIRQTLPGDTHGLCLTVDVYDVLRAFGVTCPATQHAVKKLLCAGLRGSKSAEQDIEEAANSCRRAIELLEFDL